MVNETFINLKNENVEMNFSQIPNKKLSNLDKDEKITHKKSYLKMDPIKESHHKEIKVDLSDFSVSPKLINPSFQSFDDLPIKKEKDIFDQKERLVLDALKYFDKMTKNILSTQQKDHSNDKIKDVFDLTKSHLVENLEMKRELFAIKEELSHFVKENRKLRYTYQKNQSDLEEINEKFLILNETYNFLQKKVFFFFKVLLKFS